MCWLGTVHESGSYSRWQSKGRRRDVRRSHQLVRRSNQLEDDGVHSRHFDVLDSIDKLGFVQPEGKTPGAGIGSPAVPTPAATAVPPVPSLGCAGTTARARDAAISRSSRQGDGMVEKVAYAWVRSVSVHRQSNAMRFMLVCPYLPAPSMAQQ